MRYQPNMSSTGKYCNNNEKKEKRKPKNVCYTEDNSRLFLWFNGFCTVTNWRIQKETVKKPKPNQK